MGSTQPSRQSVVYNAPPITPDAHNRCQEISCLSIVIQLSARQVVLLSGCQRPTWPLIMGDAAETALQQVKQS
jgi:hypothetical protein